MYIDTLVCTSIISILMLQVRHLFDTGECREIRIEIENVINSSTPKLARNGSCLFRSSSADRL